MLSAVSCCVVSKYFLNDADRRAASDQYYQARVRRRQARERARNEEPLDKRQASLHASFARNNAQMVSYILCRLMQDSSFGFSWLSRLAAEMTPLLDGF